MFALTALRTYILETAISVIFDGINKNFQETPDDRQLLWAHGRYWTLEEFRELPWEKQGEVMWDGFQNGKNDFLFKNNA